MAEKTSHPTPLRWAFRKISEELFVIFTVGWVILFVLESVKQGLVSHYLSLPHLAFGLLVLGIIMLSLQPEQVMPLPGKEQKRNGAILAICSLLAALTIFFITDLPPSLTILLVFVTVFALWAGSISLSKED